MDGILAGGNDQKQPLKKRNAKWSESASYSQLRKEEVADTYSTAISRRSLPRDQCKRNRNL